MRSFSIFLKKYKKGNKNTLYILNKYRNALLHFGVFSDERKEKRNIIKNALESSGLTIPIFLNTKCNFKHSSLPIYFYDYNGIEFVVKDTHSAFQNISESEENEDESDTSNYSTTTTIESDFSYDPMTHQRNNEGDIHEYLTLKALEENFENILLSYYFDGRYLLLEKAIDLPKGQYKKHVNTIYYIISFLLRHNIQHGDLLIPTLPDNNLFLVNNLNEPVVGDFGNSRYYVNSYERLQDISNAVCVLTKNNCVRINEIRNKYNLQNIVNLSSMYSKLKTKLRTLSPSENDEYTSVQNEIKRLNTLIEHLTDTSALSQEEYSQADIIVNKVMSNFFDSTKWD